MTSARLCNALHDPGGGGTNMKRDEAISDAGRRREAVASGEGVPMSASRAAGSGHPDFMLSLARGLQVARALARRKNPSTVSQLSLETGLSRSVVRRCHYTLTEVGLA